MNDPDALWARSPGQLDEVAFTQLVGQHHSLVFRLCLRMLGHRQDAEDATQETFTRVAKYLHRWDRGRPLEPWLVTIAGNRCRTLLARKRDCVPLAQTAEPAVDTADRRDAADNLLEEIQLAMEDLPANHRRAFELFHQESLSYAEIATRLDCPIGTAKTWVHRARGGLIETLRRRDVVTSPVDSPRINQEHAQANGGSQ